ncbi:hypothetical protein ACPA9J_27595 [Pseudomonas aeruginosa]
MGGTRLPRSAPRRRAPQGSTSGQPPRSTSLQTPRHYQFDGDLVTVQSGPASSPTWLGAGMIVRVEVMYQYNVTAGTGVGGRDTISGPLAQLGAFPGMVIEVTGANEGIYVVVATPRPLALRQRR